MPPDEYARACSEWTKCPEFPGLTGREKEHVYELFDNNLPDKDRTSAIVSKTFDNYLYTAINKGHNQYKIINKKRIGLALNWDDTLDEILTEVVGKDWKKYDD